MDAEDIIRQAAARRERLQRYRKDATFDASLSNMDSIPKENISITVSSETTTNTLSVSTKDVPENLKKTFASLADQYRMTDEEDSQNEGSIRSGSLSARRDQSFGRKSASLSPRKYSRTSSNTAPNPPPETNRSSPVTGEKREHISCGDTPRLRGPKLSRTDQGKAESPIRNAVEQSEEKELTLRQRKELFEKAAGTLKPQDEGKMEFNQRKNVFEEVAKKAKDPTFPRRIDASNKNKPKLSPSKPSPTVPKAKEQSPGPSSSSVADAKRKLFTHQCIEPVHEVGEITRSIQDRLLQQASEGWKQTELHKKIEEQKQEDMTVLKKRWELMAEEEKKAAERARAVQEALEQRKKMGKVQQIQRPPPLPVPGESSLNECPTKLVSIIPTSARSENQAKKPSQEIVRNQQKLAQIFNPVPATVSNRQNLHPSLHSKTTPSSNAAPPPPPPPPPPSGKTVQVSHAVISKTSAASNTKVAGQSATASREVKDNQKTVSVSMQQHQAEVKAAIARRVRMRLPEEEGTDLSEDEELHEGIDVEYSYQYHEEEVEYEEQNRMDYEEGGQVQNSDFGRGDYQRAEEPTSEESSTEEPIQIRSGILKKTTQQIQYVYENTDDTQSVFSQETTSSTSNSISLSFYRKQQKEESVKSPTKKAESTKSPGVPKNVAEEENEEKRNQMISQFQTRIDELYLASAQQHSTLKQTTTALNLCKSTPQFHGSIERAECERILLLAMKRRDAYHSEIERLRKQIDQLQKGMMIREPGCHGKVTISNIVLPTKEGFVDFVQSDRDNVHYFVVLGRCREQVHVTDMLNSAQHLEGDGTLHFSTPIDMEDLENDFVITLEVYAVQAQREKVSHEEKYHIKDSAKKKEKGFSLKKLLSNLKEETPSSLAAPSTGKGEIKASSFGCVGSCSLTLQNVHGNVFELHKVPEFSAVEHFLRCKTLCGVSLELTESGFLNIFEDVCGPSAWHRRWCQLRNDSILMWRYPEEQETHQPQVLSLRWVKGQAENLTMTQFARPHSFQMMLTKALKMYGIESSEPGPFPYVFAADTAEERFVWCEKINKVLAFIKAWIPSPSQEASHSRSFCR